MASTPPLSPNPAKQSPYPEPLIIPPLSQPHTHTIIILHGRGSTAEKFAPPLLSTPVQSPHPHSLNRQPAPPSPSLPPQADPNTAHTLHTLHPHARLIFPTAPLTRAQLYRRTLTHQWFDNWRLPYQYHFRNPVFADENEYSNDADLERDEGDNGNMLFHRSELVIEGLRETSAYLAGLVEREAALLAEAGVEDGKARIVLGGLSQGCAAVVGAVIARPEVRGKLAGVFGLCGWLPFAEEMRRAAVGQTQAEDDADEEDPFERDDADKTAAPRTAVGRATQTLREILGLDDDERPLDTSALDTAMPPVFLAHGTNDLKVDLRLARAAKACLDGMEVDVEYRECRGSGHWYSVEMLRELVVWIDRMGVEKQA